MKWCNGDTVKGTRRMSPDCTSILKRIEARVSLRSLTRRDLTSGDLTGPINGPFRS